MKILVVDDSEVDRKLITQMVREMGYQHEILESEDGNKAIEKLGSASRQIGLILCDWNMPGISGIDFVEGVAKVPALAEIPLFMVTVEGATEKVEEAKSKHPKLAGYIVKPFTIEKLKEQIEPHLKNLPVE